MTHRREPCSGLNEGGRDVGSRGWATVLTLFGLYSLLIMAPVPPAFGRAFGQVRQAASSPSDADRRGGGEQDFDLQVSESGRSVKRELAAGQRHRYRLLLSANQFLKAVVEQSGIDVIVQVVGPDGKQLVEFDSDSRLRGEETVSLVAETEGAYRLIVQPRQKGAAPGSYGIQIKELRTATDNDLALQRASQLYDEAHRRQLAGKYDEAPPLVERALEIRQRILGPDHREVGATLNNLANFYGSIGDYAKAEPLYLRALTIGEKALGPDHPNVAFPLNNLALIYSRRGEPEKAERFYLRSQAIWERAAGPEHPEVAHALGNLANLYYRRGDYAKAESNHRRALVIWEKVLGPESPEVGDSLRNLAALYAAKGDPARALTSLVRANAVSERNLALNLVTGSERQKLAYLALFSREIDFTLGLHTQIAPNDPEALNLAFTTLLRRKGRGIDAMTDTIAVLRRYAAPPDQKLFDQLVEARAQLAATTLRESGAVQPDAYRARLKPLEERVETLESELSVRSLEFRRQSQPVTLSAVQAAIPQDHVLVEFTLYTPPNLRHGSDRRPRYLAYLLAGQGQPGWVDLGEAATIDQAIAAWRQALRDPNRTDFIPLARAVDEKVMAPVRTSIQSWPGKIRHLLIAPDGLLNLIPFSALVDEEGHYLVERYTVSYLTSGRDLLRLQTSTPSKNAPLIVANPFFGRAPSDSTPAARHSVNPRAETSGQASGDLLQIFFQALPGTRQEALAIKALLPEASLLLRELVLAGVNEHRSGDDGLLTALETASLYLWGTRLVVLSACDTGVREVKNGEGVYGLRRALVLAGSETQIISLWPVSDQETRRLMVSYYQRLLKGEGRGEALRQVQLAMLKDATLNHPYYWANFIQAGEWANLEGHR